MVICTIILYIGVCFVCFVCFALQVPFCFQKITHSSKTVPNKTSQKQNKNPQPQTNRPINSQVGLLSFPKVFTGDRVEGFVGAAVSGAMDGIGIHLVDVGGEECPGQEGLSHPAVP